jgi:soluble lytic murein transglycosylase-like protein
MAQCRSSKRTSKGCLSSIFEGAFFASVALVLLVTTFSVSILMDLPTWVQAAKGASAGEYGCQVDPRYPQKVLQWCGLITRYAVENELPPDLVAALIWQESGGSAQAFSKSGAVGLMQVMPSDGPAAKFMCKNGPCFADRPDRQTLSDPEFNIQYGTRLLRGLVDYHGGDLRRALRSYGPMDVGYHYADTVLALYSRYGTP